MNKRLEWLFQIRLGRMIKRWETLLEREWQTQSAPVAIVNFGRQGVVLSEPSGGDLLISATSRCCLHHHHIM